MKMAFVGGGNMGYALALGILNSDLKCSIQVADPIESQRQRFEEHHIPTFESNAVACTGQDVILLAVKPQIIESVCKEIAPLAQNTLILSIAAGTSLTQLTDWFGEGSRVIRAMPNTPALIGEGVSGLIASAGVDAAERILADQIFSTCGDVLWFENDDQLNAVTAISGSGPAYFFYMMEALTTAGEAIGLTAKQSLALVRQTALGASRLALEEDIDPSVLRERVTSPGGTTEAAVNYLDQIDAITGIKEAAIAAYQRANELSD